MKRIFIAVRVEPEECLLGMIALLKEGLKNEKINWTNPDYIHITLAFLGDTAEKKVKIIRERLKEKCEGSGRFDLILKGSGVFKNMNDPRIIWTGIGHNEKMIRLNELVKTGLTASDVVVEDRPFKPHLTLGRIKHISDRDVLKKMLERYHDTEIQKVPVNEMIVYESILLQTGPLYKPLDKITL